MSCVTDEQLQNDGQASAIDTGSSKTGNGSVGMRHDDQRIVLGGEAFDDPLVKLVKVFVVASEQLRFEVDAFADSGK